MALNTLFQVDWDFKTAKTTYLTHGLHPYPAKYIPQIPHSLIEELSAYGETVADIFCGSGTTLVEANLLGRNAIGIDANPLACLISEAKTTRFESGDEIMLSKLIEQSQSLSGELLLRQMSPEKKLFKSNAYRPSDDALAFWFEPFVVEELAEILSWCKSLSTTTSQKIALTALSSIIVVVSKQDSDTRYVRREKDIRPGDIFLKFANALSKSVKAVSEFTKQVDNNTFCKVYHSDILSTPDVGTFDLMVCSPPYPNAYSYHLYHMTRMIWLGMDYKEFKKQEIGSHRKYGKVGASIETFRKEMKSIFDWLYQHLKEEKYACFVIGDSTIKGEKIDNAELLSSVASESGFIEHARLSRELQATKKTFNPSIGKIRDERILILQKRG
jgi:site-specific DNA-methyltransferase (cytosine-N4-specific)